MKKHITFIFVFLSLSISAFGQIDNISSQAALVTEFDADGIKVIGTGDQNEVAIETERIQIIDPYLALEGLRMIYERNQAARGDR